MTVMSHSKDLKDDFHSDTVLSILNEQRIRGILCDVTIIVEDTKFKAHSNVLAASSLYFKNIFWSRTICISGHVLELDDLKAEVFTEILNYIYSSTVVVKRQETVTDLAAAGKKLGISFLEDLTDINCSSSPCPYGFCITEKGSVKEEKNEKRHEDSTTPLVQLVKQTCSTPNKTGDFLFSREEENNSTSISGSVAAVVPPVYSCNCCTKSFEDRALLSTHLQLHMQHQEPFICKYCNQQFANKNRLENHEQTLTTSKPYICELCQKPFQSPSTLKMHMRCHTGEKPYTCKTCGKCFSVPGNLQKHERIHLGVKDFVCQYCSKAFTLNETLKIHERIHTGEKRYHCQFCLQSFLYLSTKRNHEQRHAREHNGKGYACFQCPKICKTAAALGMHQKKHLFKTECLICSACVKTRARDL
uniref:Zinc finger and BTB domain containing 38 n=1 Tax=Crocodylus porosus TaxID=8502 RepID=A0A7M4E0Q1_CROPO